MVERLVYIQDVVRSSRAGCILIEKKKKIDYNSIITTKVVSLFLVFRFELLVYCMPG